MTTSIKPTPEEMKALLLLAAKAAGLDVQVTLHGAKKENIIAFHSNTNMSWRPHADDGDLLRLADACELVLDLEEGEIIYRLFDGECGTEFFTPHNHEEMALAVIRAAAAIQRAREA